MWLRLVTLIVDSAGVRHAHLGVFPVSLLHGT